MLKKSAKKPVKTDSKKSKKKPAASEVGSLSNPYALVELKLGKKIDWEKKSPKEQRKILEDVFKMPYSALFSPPPVMNSPLYTTKIKSNGAVVS